MGPSRNSPPLPFSPPSIALSSVLAITKRYRCLYSEDELTMDLGNRVSRKKEFIPPLTACIRVSSPSSALRLGVPRSGCWLPRPEQVQPSAALPCTPGMPIQDFKMPSVEPLRLERRPSVLYVDPSDPAGKVQRRSSEEEWDQETA